MDDDGFVVLTIGLAAAGKSTIAKTLKDILEAHYNTKIAWLEVDKYLNAQVGDRDPTSEEKDSLDSILIRDLKGRISCGENIILDSGFSEKERRERYKDAFRNNLGVYVKCPLYLCLYRDFVRSLKSAYPRKSFVYTRALFSTLTGISNFTIQGINRKFDIPSNPDVTIQTKKLTPTEGAYKIVHALLDRGYVKQ